MGGGHLLALVQAKRWWCQMLPGGETVKRFLSCVSLAPLAFCSHLRAVAQV